MYYYIVNPAAGGGVINSIQDRLKSTLRSLKIDGEFAKTLGEGDATVITNKALDRGIKTLVAVGGGETVNEIISAIFSQRKSDVALGIIPTGRQNALAGAMGIQNWREACQVLASRRLIEFSLMSVNDQVFIQSLIIAHSLPITDDEESTSRLSKFFSSPKRPAKNLDFKATLDNQLKFQGQAPRVEVYNQKFVTPTAENQLLIQIHEAAEDKAGLGSLVGGLFGKAPKGESPAFSQLHGQKLELNCQSPAEASLDGKTISDKKFEIALTEWKLKMITNLVKPPAEKTEIPTES